MYLLYGNHSAPSGRALRSVLSCRGGFLSHLERNPNAANDLLIRYGVSGGSDAPTTLNRAEAIATAAHKTKALLAMDAAGVLVPRYDTMVGAQSLDPDNHTILGRENVGSGGTDIRVYRPGETVGRHRLYTQFVPSVREMRIHIFQGEMIHAQVKQYQGDGPEDEYPIRNHTRGYVFVPYVRTQPNRDRVDAAAAAVSALGLDFGAVDVLVGTDGRVYVLEVNTGPGTTPRTTLAYARAIAGWCNARGLSVELNTDDLELDSEEEACYTDSGEATSPAEQAIPTPTVTDSADGAGGQDRAATDEREALRARITELEQLLEVERTISDQRRVDLVQIRALAQNLLGEV